MVGKHSIGGQKYIENVREQLSARGLANQCTNNGNKHSLKKPEAAYSYRDYVDAQVASLSNQQQQLNNIY